MLRIAAGQGLGLFLGQAHGQGCAILSGKGGFVDLRGGAVEGQAQPGQQFAAIGRTGGEQKGRHAFFLIYRDAWRGMLSSPQPGAPEGISVGRGRLGPWTLAPMLNGPIPPHVAPRTLADRGAVLQGEISLSALPRLAEQMVDHAGTVRAKLSFERDERRAV